MATLRIGDLVSLSGRTYEVRGFEPMSVATNLVELEDVETGACRRVPLVRLELEQALAAIDTPDRKPTPGPGDGRSCSRRSSP